MKNQEAREQEGPGDVPAGFGKALATPCFLRAPNPTSASHGDAAWPRERHEGHGCSFAVIPAQEEILPAGHSPSVNHISLIQTPC